MDDVSFDVGAHRVMGLRGPNGSGKTTILRILTGYLRPSAGTVRVAGFDVVRESREARGRVGYVPEDAPLYPHMRVNEFLEFMVRLRGLHGGRLRETSQAMIIALLFPALVLLSRFAWEKRAVTAISAVVLVAAVGLLAERTFVQ